MSAAKDSLIEMEREAAEQGRHFGREKLRQRLQAIADEQGWICPGSGEPLREARLRHVTLIPTLGTLRIRPIVSVMRPDRRSALNWNSK